MMSSQDVAAMLEKFATDVERIRGISRNNPHTFVEDKSEVAGAIRRRARELRSVPAAPKPPQKIEPGSVVVGCRAVAVEVRRRKRA